MGLVKYRDALELQAKLVECRRQGSISDTLLSLQHPPTFTVGKRRTVHNIVSSPEVLESIGAEVHYTERGGDVTFHGPGQAILYPIISLREAKLGARRYVEGLEDTMIKLCALHKIKAKGRMTKETGVWVENRKIGAIGVRISGGGIASHGLAFNINPDLNFYTHIIPCGIPDKEVTSLHKESFLQLPDEDPVTQQLIKCFIEVFGYEDVTWKTT
ncbi:hypothetical protein KP509_05G001700 [Ceratopteris richardii]|nr:hypothetical protein KP509_05G001700 [Ceratopteris richardii]